MIKFKGIKKVYGEDTENLIIVFNDYECPSCKSFNNAFKKIQKELDGFTVHYVHKPLKPHKNARLAAYFAECSQQQKKFDQVHEYLFKNQKDLKGALDSDKISFLFNLNSNKLNECLESRAVEYSVDRGLFLSDSLNITSVPSYIIKNKIYVGVLSKEKILKLLKDKN